MAGSFTIIDSDSTQKITGLIGSNTRQYVEQTSKGTATKIWKFKWTAPSSNVGDIKFYIAVNCADGDGLAGGGDVIYTDVITVKPSSKLPTASFTSSASQICLGDSISFSGSGTNNPTSYSWTFTNGVPPTSSSQNPKVTWKAAGNYNVSLQVTNAYGKSAIVTRQFFVKTKPDTLITVSGPTQFCEGDSVKLTATPGMGAYKWNTGETGQSIYAKKTGSYSTSLYNGACSSYSQTINIVVRPRPDPVIKNNLNGHGVTDTATVCEGDSAVITVTPGPKYATYTFYDKISMLQTGPNNVFVAKNMTFAVHRFSVLVTDSNGCSSVQSDPVSVLFKRRTSAPVLSAGTSTTSSVTVNWATVVGAAAFEVSADSGKTWKTPSGGATAKTHTETGLTSDQSLKIMVRAIDNTVCKYGLIKELVVKTIPCSQLTYELKYDQTVCAGSSGTTITFLKMSSPTYAIMFNGGAPSKNLTYPVPAADASYHFELVDSAKLNCPSIKEDVNITVEEIPALTVSTASAVYCTGDEVTIKGDGNFAGYEFYVNDVLKQGSSAAIYKTTALKPGDSVTVVGITAHGCRTKPVPSMHQVFNHSLPGIMLVQVHGLDITVKDTTPDAAGRKWYFGDGVTSTYVYDQHSYTAAGKYTLSLVVTNFGNCKDSTSMELDLKPSGIAGQRKAITGMSVAPNPADDKLTITLYIGQSSHVLLKLYDGRGMPVYSGEPRSFPAGRQDIVVPVGHLKGGVYFLQVVSADGSVLAQKILKKQER
jgi:PKD repeat protein